MKQACPIPTTLLDKIHAARFIRRAKAKLKPKKPYFQADNHSLNLNNLFK